MCQGRQEPGVEELNPEGQQPPQDQQQPQVQQPPLQIQQPPQGQQQAVDQNLAAALATLQAGVFNPELPHLARMDLMGLYDSEAEMDDQTFE